MLNSFAGVCVVNCARLIAAYKDKQRFAFYNYNCYHEKSLDQDKSSFLRIIVVSMQINVVNNNSNQLHVHIYVYGCKATTN